MKQTSVTRQRGATLLEVLISFVIMAIGLLGIAGIFVLSLKANNSSIAKQYAIEATHNIIDKMRANSQSAIKGFYNVNNISTGSAPPTPSVLCTVSACTSTQLAAYDIWDWLVNDVAKLAGGTGSIQVTPNASNSGGTATITVQWDDSQVHNTLGRVAQSGTSPNYVSLTMQTQL